MQRVASLRLSLEKLRREQGVVMGDPWSVVVDSSLVWDCSIRMGLLRKHVIHYEIRMGLRELPIRILMSRTWRLEKCGCQESLFLHVQLFHYSVLLEYFSVHIRR